MGDPTLPNREQAERWDGDEGEHWVAEADRYDQMGASFGEALLDAADLRAGERVLDIGCGNGAITIEAARRVQPGGAATGIDISAPMLALATGRAATAGVDNVDFLRADAQTHTFDAGTYDALISRSGVMFFDDPDAAFANLARALRRGGRMAFVAWQGLERSPWIMVPGAAAAAHVGLPDGIAPNAPGPFGLADPERTRAILEGAGLGNVAITDVTRPMCIGDDVDDAVSFLRSIPLVRDLLTQSSADKQAAAIEAVHTALEPYASSDGVVIDGNSAWLVQARR